MNSLNRFADPVYCLVRLIIGLAYACHGGQKLFAFPGGGHGMSGLAFVVCRGNHRTRVRPSNCLWIVHEDRSIFRERRNGRRLFRVLCGHRAYSRGEIFSNYEWR
jgi:hypothetical protein